MEDDSVRQRKKSVSDESPSPQPAPAAPTTIPPNLSPKEAYFELLRVWVNQANICHNAMACFPYYLAANYPQLFQYQRTGVDGSLGQTVPIVNQPQPQQQPIPEPPQIPIGIPLFGNGNRNQQRNDESKLSGFNQQ